MGRKESRLLNAVAVDFSNSEIVFNGFGLGRGNVARGAVDDVLFLLGGDGFVESFPVGVGDQGDDAAGGGRGAAVVFAGLPEAADEVADVAWDAAVWKSFN